MNNQAGKGHAPRPYDWKKFHAGHDRAFPKDTTAISEKADRELRGRVIDGREYLGRGGWKNTDKCECQLRDERI